MSLALQKILIPASDRPQLEQLVEAERRLNINVVFAFVERRKPDWRANCATPVTK